MLALAINLLFAVAALAAVLTLVDTAMKTRRAYDRLMRERALMDAGFVMQVETSDCRLRRATRRPVATPPRRSPLPQPVPVRAAA